jgi:hypothetical protein
MPLTNTAYLEVERENRTGVFELTSVEQSRSLDRRMLIGPRGQALQGVLDLGSQLPFGGALGDIGTPGQGVSIDGGQGEHVFELEAEITAGALSNWGDGSGNGKFDAPAKSDSLFKREDVINFFCRTAQTDSLTPGRLYWSEWTDGTYAASAGAHNQPADVLVRQLETTVAKDESFLDVFVELPRTETFPNWDPSEVSDAFDDLK